METNNRIKIGGEFEIDPIVLSGCSDYIPQNDVFLYSSGRSALMTILLHLGKNRPKVIHVPYYICASVVKACENAGFQVNFYELNKDFLFPLEFLSNIGIKETLMTVNYFGFVDDNPSILKIKENRPDINIVSDQVQSFWTYSNTKADFSFTSLRKHFPMPDGALIHSNDNTFIHSFSISESIFYKNKLLGAILKYQGIEDRVYLKFFNNGEEELNNEKNNGSKASFCSQYLFDNLDLKSINKRRKENYKFVYEYGQQYGLDFVFPFTESVAPLNVPILINNRNKIRMELMQKNIFLPVHWVLDYFNTKSTFSENMSKTQLSLVIDQRYSVIEIEREINELLKISKYYGG